MNTSYTLLPAQAEQVIRAAMAICDRQWVDVLDCSVSFARQRSSKSPEDLLAVALAEPRTFWSFIFRGAMGREPAFAELGCRTTMNGKDYFLWVILPPEAGWALVRQFSLEPV